MPVCTVIDRRWVLLVVWVAVSEVAVLVWVLAVARIFVSAVDVAVVVTVVDGDVAVGTRRSGCETRCWGGIGRLGSVCRRFAGADSRFEVGQEVGVVTVVDVDGGGDRTVDIGGEVCVTALVVVAVVIWVLSSSRPLS